jgi:hypothetical protein
LSCTIELQFGATYVHFVPIDTSTSAGSPYDETLRRLRHAGEAHDAQQMISLLANDVIIRSPITERIRFEGIDQAQDLFTRVFDCISDIRFYDVVGSGTDHQVIFWRGRVGSTPLEEANLLRLNADGQISEMTVFMRAIPGLLQLVSVLAPSLASRHGRVRATLLRAQLAVISAIYRLGEPLALRLAHAGVAAPDRAAELAARRP